MLRVEVIVNNIAELRCGKRLDKLPGMLQRLQRIVVEFLGVVQAAHLSLLEAKPLDQLALPTVRSRKRVAGVDLQKPRVRAVAEAVLALAAAPEGFTAQELAERLRAQQGRRMAGYHKRKAAYDLCKLRGKLLGQRIAGRRAISPESEDPHLGGHAHPARKSAQAGIGRSLPPQTSPPTPQRPRLGRSLPESPREMLATLQTLKLVA